MTDDSKIPLCSPLDRFNALLVGGVPVKTLLIIGCHPGVINTFNKMNDLHKQRAIVRLTSEKHLQDITDLVPDIKEQDLEEIPKKNIQKGPQPHRKFGLVKKL